MFDQASVGHDEVENEGFDERGSPRPSSSSRSSDQSVGKQELVDPVGSLGPPQCQGARSHGSRTVPRSCVTEVRVLAMARSQRRMQAETAPR